MISLQNEANELSEILSCMLPWYAIRAKSNQEKLVALNLKNKGFNVYLPMYRSRRRWSDRIVEKEIPYFPGYVFCRLDVIKRLPILTTPGVVDILGFGREPAALPEQEIETIQAVLGASLRAEPHPFLQYGQRIRISRGSLEGHEGILLKQKGEWRMIVSVTMLQRSVSVEVDRECISVI